MKLSISKTVFLILAVFFIALFTSVLAPACILAVVISIVALPIAGALFALGFAWVVNSIKTESDDD